jgi:hypothetical protein
MHNEAKTSKGLDAIMELVKSNHQEQKEILRTAVEGMSNT